jgi:tetratricopeptide (TPR) repeat protein
LCPPGGGAAPEEKKKSKQCQRCDVNKAAQKVTITTIPLKLCQTCTDVVQSDPVEAVAAIEKATGIKLELKKQEPPVTMCERCKKRPAHGRFVFDGKPTLCCQPCFTEHPDFQQMTKYGVACVWHKDFDEARSAFMELIKMTPNHAGTLYNLACVESLLNNKEEGFSVLGRALENGYNNWRGIAADEDMAVVRSHEGYAALISKWQENERLNRGPGAGQRMMSAAKTALVKAKDSVKDGVSEAVRKAKEAQQAREEEREERRALEGERRALEEERRAIEEERRALEEARAAEESQRFEQEQFSNLSNSVFNAPPASIGNYASVSAVHNPNFVSSQQFSMPQNNFMPRARITTATSTTAVLVVAAVVVVAAAAVAMATDRPDPDRCLAVAACRRRRCARTATATAICRSAC